MAKHVIEVPDYDPERGVVTLSDEGGVIRVRADRSGIRIEADPAGLRDLARWCLALADEHAPDGEHVEFDPGWPLAVDSDPLMLGRIGREPQAD